jgi:hypothetical protein
MKSLYFIIIILLSVANTASAQSWQWARAATGTNTGSVVCSDSSGNVYVAGYFTGGLTIGSDSAYDTNGPYQDVFMAKYNALGNLLWVRNSNGYADVEGISADANGNVYVVGNFYNDSVSFGSTTLINPNPGGQNSNIYFTKYDPLGNVLWAKNLGGINNDLAAGVSTDAFGNVYVTGNFMGDSLSFGSVTVQHIGSSDGFVAKFTATGDAVWAANVGAPVSIGSVAVCTDAAGSVIMTGYFQYNYMYVGSLSTPVSSPYSNNIFITKYDSTGQNHWIRYAGNNYGISSTGIAADTSGNVYVTGYYNDTITLGSDTLVSIGYQNIFTAQYNASGAVMWARSAGGKYVDQANGISTDAAGNSYVTGYFQSDTSLFDNTKLINTTGNQVTFVAKYDPAGRMSWAIAPSKTSNNWGAGIAYSNASVYVTGNFQGSAIVFGSDTLLTSQQGFFLAKLDTPTILTGIAPVPGTDGKISVYPNPSTGTFYFAGITSGASIGIYNILGQNITSPLLLHDGVGMIDLSTYNKGIYFYTISEQGNVVQKGKIVLE